MKVLNFGSMNIDYTYELEHFVQPGETISSNVLNTNCGGKGLNQSVAMSKAGVSVYHAGMVGKNDGKFLLDTLQSYGVHTDYVKSVDSKTGHAIIQVSNIGENCIILYSGSNSKISHPYVDYVLQHFEAGDFCVLQNEISCVDYIIKQAHQKGMHIILNPSPCNKALLSYPLNLVEYFLLNEVEGEQITGQSQPKQILSSLTKLYPESKFVLTLGKLGVVYKSKEIEISHGIYDVPVVDSTAAGDTFTGYFIYSVINNLPADEALELASAASSLAVSKKGAAASIPCYSEVIQFIKTYSESTVQKNTVNKEDDYEKNQVVK